MTSIHKKKIKTPKKINLSKNNINIFTNKTNKVKQTGTSGITVQRALYQDSYFLMLEGTSRDYGTLLYLVLA